MSTSDYFNYTLSKDIKYAIVELFSSDAEFSDNEEKKCLSTNCLQGAEPDLPDLPAIKYRPVSSTE